MLVNLFPIPFCLGEESILPQNDERYHQIERIIEDKTKFEKLAQYLRDRDCPKISTKYPEQEMQKKWLREWSELYPNPTRTVLYQALIHVGEHAAARSLLLSQLRGKQYLLTCFYRHFKFGCHSICHNHVTMIWILVAPLLDKVVVHGSGLVLHCLYESLPYF